jgi:hypothetical protein
MGKSLSETARAILMKESANAETLKPNSKMSEKSQTLGSVTKIADAPVEAGSGSNVGAAAAAPLKKDTSKPTVGARSETSKKTAMAEEMEDDGSELVAESEELDEEIEISEELSAFIDEMIEEGYSEEEIANAIDENFEVVSEDVIEEEVEEDAYEVDMSEHVEALLAGEELSEDFKVKATTIFEAAVKQKVEEEIARLEEAYAETLEEHVAEIQEQLSSNVDDYLNYVVEHWVSENEVAIDAGLRTEVTEDFISGLRNLFAEHYIDIPEDKVSVVEEMANKVAELEEKLNEEIEFNVSLKKVLNESRRNEIIESACSGLVDTQVEKLKTLSEGLDFTSAAEFSQKINVLRESYFTPSVKTENVLDSVEVTDGKGMISENLSGPMAAYVRTLGRQSSK